MHIIPCWLCHFVPGGKFLQEMMNSDMMEEVLGNPEKMEQARQAILENPTLKQAMAQLPGFSDMVSELASLPTQGGTGVCCCEGRRGLWERCLRICVRLFWREYLLRVARALTRNLNLFGVGCCFERSRE